MRGAKKIFPRAILGTRAMGSVVLLWSLSALIAEMEEQKTADCSVGFIIPGFRSGQPGYVICKLM